MTTLQTIPAISSDQFVLMQKELLHSIAALSGKMDQNATAIQELNNDTKTTKNVRDEIDNQ